MVTEETAYDILPMLESQFRLLGAKRIEILAGCRLPVSQENRLRTRFARSRMGNYERAGGGAAAGEGVRGPVAPGKPPLGGA